MSLAILVPSRGRPQNLRRLVDAVAATATGEYRIYTYIDDDDRTADAYRGLNVRPTVGPRIFYAPAVNVLARIATDDPPDLSMLVGYDLACWCPLDGGPCHADVLLELANR